MLLFANGAASAEEGVVNSVKSIKTAKSGAVVEITITSTKKFLQSDLPVLLIGDQEFTISRYPDDGSSDTLIFTLDAKDFQRTENGDRVIFQYGRGEGRNQRDFGVLDKSRLDK